MPEENMQDPAMQENTAQTSGGLDDNTSAAALAHATYLSEGLLREQNPMVDMEMEEAPQEETPEQEEQTGGSEEELQGLKADIAELREMVQQALDEPEDDKIEENEQE